jgi:hypothetical protein
MAKFVTDRELIEALARAVGRRRSICRGEEGRARYERFLRKLGEAVSVLEPVDVGSVSGPDVPLSHPKQREGANECELGLLRHVVAFNPLPGIEVQKSLLRRFDASGWGLALRDRDGARFARIGGDWFRDGERLSSADITNAIAGEIHVISPEEMTRFARPDEAQSMAPDGVDPEHWTVAERVAHDTASGRC